MSGTIYLPLVSGILQAYAQTFPVLKENYDFQPYIFIRDTPENMIKDVEDPFIMAFSICIWNERLSIEVAKLIRKRFPACWIVFGGPQVTKDYIEKYSFVDQIIQEEGEKKFVQLLGRMIANPIDMYNHNLHNYPSPYTLGLYDKYFTLYPDMTFQAIVETNRGCPFTCSFPLRGDTLVNTMYGDITIKDLYEKGVDKYPVYTYNFDKDKVEISDAINIKNYGLSSLVRVEFTDGTHIDCSPIHRFWTFKVGRKSKQPYSEEKPVMAKDLIVGQRIKALRFELGGKKGNQYVYATWARRKRNKRSRIVMEYLLNKELTSKEQVHHKDRNKLNDHPDNLEYCESSKAHFDKHPEHSIRMRENNPAKNMTPEWKEKLRLSVTGKKRSMEQRIHYRESKLGNKNPMWKGGISSNTISRLDKEINHKVRNIIFLEEKDDVYCMTLPNHGWFFAGNVLIENCYWGQGFEEKKVRHHELDHVREEAEWIGRNKIKYVFMADANFGMYERDYEVAKIYCDVREKYGYPDKVRVCYGKNKEENVFKVAKLMHQHGLAKAITLARQSNNAIALSNIRRSNIKLSVYDNLRERYAKEGISTYTEIILGMPGETKESFIKGVEEIAGTPTQLFIYHCTILPNTEMADPAYIAKHGIKTVRVPLTEIHGEIRKSEYVTEYEDIVIETATMPMQDWIDCAVYSWMTQLKCVFGMDNIPSHEVARFQAIAENITNGYSRGQVDLRFSSCYLEPEEAAFCRISLERGEVTGDLFEWCKQNVIWGRKSKVQKIKEIA